MTQCLDQEPQSNTTVTKSINTPGIEPRTSRTNRVWCSNQLSHVSVGSQGGTCNTICVDCVTILQQALHVTPIISTLSSIPQFDGLNYAIWSAGLKAYLAYLGIDDFITTSITSPTNPTEFAKHEANAKKASSIVMLSIKSSLWHLFSSKEEPKD